MSNTCLTVLGRQTSPLSSWNSVLSAVYSKGMRQTGFHQGGGHQPFHSLAPPIAVCGTRVMLMAGGSAQKSPAGNQCSFQVTETQQQLGASLL